ncbi:MAG: Phosphate metabolism transcription protein [Chrysothrix sp. TS-e1954]|nr:MAG: Phosphate metabolism transcription protein [Chrysothrix sp. TS-e1954]
MDYAEAFAEVYPPSQVTSFLPSHPGGSKIVLQLAGQDATAEYDPVHPAGTLEENLPTSANLGLLDTSTLPTVEKPTGESTSSGESSGPPPLSSLLNLSEIEEAATPLLQRKAWAYYYSGSDDLYSKTLNNTAYRSILLRPRIFVDCTKCNTSTTVVGHHVSVPFFVSPAAMARLAHADGERGIGAACGLYGAAQMVSNNASMTPEQVVEGTPGSQVFGWQLYVQTDRSKSEAMLARIAKLPQFKFIVLTLDAPVPGKREDDERTKNVGSNLSIRSAVQQDQGKKQEESGGVGKALFAGTAADLTWKTTLPWLAKHTDLPIILKGIQTHEDAYMASLYTPQIRGIILSNHGGRALDTAPPAVHTLLEIRRYCPEVFKTLDVLVDGGIKRGTDVVKALCLGAKAVGLGRAPLFGLGVGGQQGVERVFESMHFEKSLKRAIYAPWREQYIDYPKLKTLLKDYYSDAGEDGNTGKTEAGDDADDWTESDEGAFVEELVNVQLEKVHGFQSTTVQTLRDRTAKCEERLETIAPKHKTKQTTEDNQHESGEGSAEIEELGDLTEEAVVTLRDVLKELNGITKEMNELERFSRINYTGFLKATKKHDRKRGHSYRIRPLMQVRLAALPFNKEDYSPLLFRLSTMYAFIRQRLDNKGKQKGNSFSESETSTDDFTAYKFWVHPDNLLELKTMILRRLPVLVYNPLSSSVAESELPDPTITSIYFDNATFSLYNAKVGHETNATSLRLRWYDGLSKNPEVFCEKKTILEDGSSHEQRFTISKQKYIQPFLRGEYKMDKDIRRNREKHGDDSEQAHRLEKTVEDIQTFMEENDLQPMLRANYNRTAYQIPGDSRVRITLDTDLAMIREDALNAENPIRSPDDWHRLDIDEGGMEFPFARIRKGEISRFPYALLEIRVRGGKKYEWAADLMNSHLVVPAPRFSKFVHGVAQLFDDHVNTFPFWLSDVDTDIRRDPQQAFEEEQQKKAQAADDQFAVGSLLRSNDKLGSYKPAIQTPVGSPHSTRSDQQPRPRKATVDMTRRSPSSKLGKAAAQSTVAEGDSDEDDDDVKVSDSRGMHSFYTSIGNLTSRKTGPRLPPGIQEPTFWIKNEGPVKVEAKVWLANQRTFIKWQHIGVLLASLSLGLFNAAGANNDLARSLAVVYTLVAVFAVGWGWSVYMTRSRLIRERSGKDFDNVFGPIVVCVGLIIALCLNFTFKYQNIQQQRRENKTLVVGSLGAFDDL